MRIRFLVAAVALLGVIVGTRAATAHAQDKKETLLTPAQCKADIAFAFAVMEDVHPNLYAWTPKSTVARERATLEKSLTAPLTKKEFWKRFAPLVARLRDGHTWLPAPLAVWTPYRDSDAGVFPLDTRISGGKMFVKANYSTNPEPGPGAEITAIDGIPSPTLLRLFLPYANDELIPSRENQIANSLRSWLYLVLGKTAPFAVESLPTDGGKAITVLPGVPWSAVVAGRKVALTNAGPQSFYRYRLLNDDKIGLIEYEQCVDLPKFEIFLKETFAQLQKDKPRALLIDVRRNAGGNGGLNEALCGYITDKPYRIFGKAEIKISDRVKKQRGHDAYLPQYSEEAWTAKDGTLLTQTVDFFPPEPNPLRWSGPVYCLVGPGTFSNGMAFASAVKDCHLGTLVGEETGGVGSAYGDYVTFPLPHSGFELNISSKHIFRPSGIDDGRGILPDVEAHQTPEDTAKGRDTVLEAARQIAVSGHR